MSANALRSSIGIGVATAIVVSIPLFFVIGAGGALVCAVAGAIASAVVQLAIAHAAQRTQDAMMARTQIEGVLDSSQLDATTPSLEQALPIAGKSKAIGVAVALVASLATGGIVAAATGGAGINFYLGGSSSTGTAKPQKDASTEDEQDTGANFDAQTQETPYSEPADSEDPVASPQSDVTPSSPAPPEQTPTDASSGAQDQNAPAADDTKADEQQMPDQQPSDDATMGNESATDQDA